MKSALNKIAVLVLSLLTLCGCSNTKNIPGNYKIEQNPVTEIFLTLNDDGSFIEFINSHGCGPAWYFGFYKVIKRRIQLKQISGDVNFLNKNDTLVYYKNAELKDRKIMIVYNEQKPFDIADVYANGNIHLGKVDEDGSLSIPDSLLLDSIRIESGIFKRRYFNLKQKYFDRLFIVIYDYAFVNCTDFTFASNSTLEITSKGLLFYPNWERRKKPKRVFLERE